MITFRTAVVKEVITEREEYEEILVEVGDLEQKAICYKNLIGRVKRNDRVVINTIAVDLGLGTGGYHYVVFKLSDELIKDELTNFNQGPGHIVKLRYTPYQLKCLAVEEKASPYHEVLKEADNINGMPTIIGTLHSQLPAAALTIKKLLPHARVAYIMTDGAALPIAFSNLVAKLKDISAIDVTITVGHAFGGMMEAVNIYSGLVAAKHAAKADIAIVCMGPGIVGTSTKLGYTGIEQGQIINAVNSLKGIPIAIPRISFSDQRKRHLGLSHHTITALTIAALTKAIVTLPKMDNQKSDLIHRQIKESQLDLKHDIVEINADLTIELLQDLNFRVTTMGRGVDKEPEFFKSAGAAAIYAAKLIEV